MSKEVFIAEGHVKVYVEMEDPEDEGALDAVTTEADDLLYEIQCLVEQVLKNQPEELGLRKGMRVEFRLW